jgi:hypothetical protein
MPAGTKNLEYYILKHTEGKKCKKCSVRKHRNIDIQALCPAESSRSCHQRPPQYSWHRLSWRLHVGCVLVPQYPRLLTVTALTQTLTYTLELRDLFVAMQLPIVTFGTKIGSGQSCYVGQFLKHLAGQLLRLAAVPLPSPNEAMNGMAPAFQRLAAAHFTRVRRTEWPSNTTGYYKMAQVEACWRNTSWDHFIYFCSFPDPTLQGIDLGVPERI